MIPLSEVIPISEVINTPVNIPFETFFGVLFEKDCDAGSCQLLKFSNRETKTFNVKKTQLNTEWYIQHAEPISTHNLDHDKEFISAFRVSNDSIMLFTSEKVYTYNNALMFKKCIDLDCSLYCISESFGGAGSYVCGYPIEDDEMQITVNK